MTNTQVSRHLRSPRSRVYAALLDPALIPRWKVPDGMTCQVHAFEACEGGKLRVSLTYDAPDNLGKTTAHTDTYHGYFAKLLPNQQIVEIDEFESEDPALRGEMTITITLTDAADGTLLTAVHEGLPATISASDNELGWQMALNKLAAIVESE